MTTEEDIMKAANRYEVLMKVENGLITMREAAIILGITTRHCRRLRRRAEKRGMKGLCYDRSHPAWNRVDRHEEAKILRLRESPYKKLNTVHLRDRLLEDHGIDHSREYYRQLLIRNKLYASKQKKRREKHRKRFEAPQSGLLIQRDTSIHLWASESEKPWRLILDLDDHSRKITGAFFSYHDDVLSNMLVAWETLSTHGLPHAYYTDNNPIFNPLNKKASIPGQYRLYRVRTGEDQETVSQFKRALTEIGIQMIHATPYQPQGKGKVERIFRFMQDRLIKEMEIHKIKDIHSANKHLKKWVNWYNHKHVHSITKMIPNERYLKKNGFRELPKEINLEQVFCLKYSRQVKSDNTFQLEGQTYQVRPNAYRISYAKAQVEIRIYLSRKMKVFYKGKEIDSFAYLPKYPREDILALH